MKFKKYKYIIFLIIELNGIIAFSQKRIFDGGAQFNDVKGKVLKIVEMEYSLVDTLDSLVVGELLKVDSVRFDFNGNITSEKGYNGKGKLSHEYKSKYNALGQMIERDCRYYSDLKHWWGYIEKFQYDKKGNLILKYENSYRHDYLPKYKNRWEYVLDSVGNIVKELYFPPSSMKPSSIQLNRFSTNYDTVKICVKDVKDNNERIEKILVYYPDGKIKINCGCYYKTINYYDIHGFDSIVEDYDQNWKLGGSLYYLYKKIDENENWTEKISGYNSVPKNLYRREISYIK